MSKVLVIPDMHGSHNWEKAKEIIKEHPDWYAVCLGDWVDSGIYDRKIKAWRSNNKWPDQGENFDQYLGRVKDQYLTLELPPELQGELFCFMGIYELGEYLKKRYGWSVEEEIQYYIWH